MDYFSSAEFRHRARLALTGRLPVAAMIIFLANLPTLLAQMLVMIAEQPLQRQLSLIYVGIANTGVLPTLDSVTSTLSAGITSSLLLSWGVYLLAMLITPFLSLGLIASLLTMLRGGECTWMDVFCRKNCFLRAIGLTLLVAIKIILWALPGYAFYGIFATLAIYFESTFLLYLSIFGLLAGVVLAIRAALHYSFATTVMADRPQLKIRDCIRESISIMRLRKMQLFLLNLSFFGWYLLATLVSTLCSGMWPVLGTMASMITSLALSLYILTAECAFYDEYKDKPCIYVKQKRRRADKNGQP